VRLSEGEKAAILEAVRRFDPDARVFLFGSRTDDSRKGGDIDLLVLSDSIGPSERRRIRRAICDAIGEQKIDLLIATDMRDPMVRLAHASGVPLR
jgi:predicted nucleotidyltransferase